jgi:hypothetical protein
VDGVSRRSAASNGTTFLPPRYFGTFERTREHDFFTVATGKPEFYKPFGGTFEGFNPDDLVAAPVHTTSAGFSQGLTSDTAVHVDGIYQKATDIPTDVQVNTRNPVTLVRPLPEWDQIIQRQSRPASFPARPRT